MKEFEIVVATDAAQGIGIGGKLPWHLPGDLKFFRELTIKTRSPGKKNVVVMGRKTWESIPVQFRPLPGRINIVLTKNKYFTTPMEVIRANSFEDAFSVLEQPPLKNIIERVFVIGGAQIFQEALTRPECTKLHITQILQNFNCDTFFPAYHAEFERRKQSAPHQDGEMIYYFSEYDRIQHPSSQEFTPL